MRARTMVYLDKEQQQALRAEAAREGISMAELFRRILRDHVNGRRGSQPVPREAYLKIIGLGASGRSDISERHDAYLAEALRRAHTREHSRRHRGVVRTGRHLRSASRAGTGVLPADLEAAWHIAQAYPDQSFSFVDCATFALMERQGIDRAVAFDAHFLVYRFGPGRRKAFQRVPR